MATLTVFASTADGFIQSTSTSYSSARSGANLTVNTTATLALGQLFATPDYYCFEAFVSFDTSSLGAGSTVTAATLSVDGSFNGSDTDFTIEARIKDWGATVTTADYVAGASLSSQTLVASISSASYSTSYMDLTSEAAFPANVSKTGTTYIMFDSSRQVAGTTPTGSEYIEVNSANTAGTTEDPKLVVTYTPAPATATLRMMMGVGV